MNENINRALRRLGEVAAECSRALARVWEAYAAAVCAIFDSVDFVVIFRAMRARDALAEASPRVRHLACSGKKYRTRKKNINRALREYERRHRDGKG